MEAGLVEPKKGRKVSQWLTSGLSGLQTPIQNLTDKTRTSFSRARERIGLGTSTPPSSSRSLDVLSQWDLSTGQQVAGSPHQEKVLVPWEPVPVQRASSEKRNLMAPPDLFQAEPARLADAEKKGIMKSNSDPGLLDKLTDLSEQGESAGASMDLPEQAPAALDMLPLRKLSAGGVQKSWEPDQHMTLLRLASYDIPVKHRDAAIEARLGRVESHEYGDDYTKEHRDRVNAARNARHSAERRKSIDLMMTDHKKTHVAQKKKPSHSPTHKIIESGRRSMSDMRRPTAAELAAVARSVISKDKPPSSSSAEPQLAEQQQQQQQQQQAGPNSAPPKGRKKRDGKRVQSLSDLVSWGRAAAEADNAEARKKLSKAVEKTRKELQDLKKKKFKARRTQELDGHLLAKTLLTVAIGILGGFCIQFVNFLSTQVLYDPKQNFTEWLLSSGSLGLGFLFHASTSALLALASSALILWTCPPAGGSGIPEVKTYLSGALYKAHMEKPRTLGVKIISLSLLAASGMPAARDMIHVVCILASNVCKLWSQWEERRKVPPSEMMFRRDGPRFTFISAGVAAAIGGGFRSPVTGILFAFEEFSAFWTTETLGRCLVASGLASLITWYFTGNTKSFEDTSGDFDGSIIHILPAGRAEEVTPEFRLWEIFPLFFLGVLGGLFGAWFVIVNGKNLAVMRKKHMPGKYLKHKKLTEVALVAVICSIVAVLLPAMWPCRDLTNLEKASMGVRGVTWRYSTCPKGQVNEMAALCLNLQGTAMNNLFSEGHNMQFSVITLLVYAVAYFLVTAITVGTATPSGAFIPMVLVGAAVGRALGVCVQAVGTNADIRTYAMMGGAATFAGFLRMPLSMTALFIELSGSPKLGAPLLLICSVATVVANAICVSNTDFVCAFNDYPVLQEKPPKKFIYYTAFDIMTEIDKGQQHDPICIGINDPVIYAAAILKHTTHSVYPVVMEHRPDKADRLKDMTLLGLVKRKVLQRIVDEAMSQEIDASKKINIMDVMDLNPWYCPDNCPAMRVHKQFIKMGLRQLIVVKAGTMQVRGVITRHDLHECILQWPDEKEIRGKVKLAD